MILAVDFDLTICSDSSFGEPMEGAVSKLAWLNSRGHKIVVHTVKANTGVGKDYVNFWLTKHKIRTHDVVGKVQADVYVDDKGLKFEDWEQVWNALR